MWKYASMAAIAPAALETALYAGVLLYPEPNNGWVQIVVVVFALPVFMIAYWRTAFGLLGAESIAGDNSWVFVVMSALLGLLCSLPALIFFAGGPDALYGYVAVGAFPASHLVAALIYRVIRRSDAGNRVKSES